MATPGQTHAFDTQTGAPLQLVTTHVDNAAFDSNNPFNSLASESSTDDGVQPAPEAYEMPPPDALGRSRASADRAWICACAPLCTLAEPYVRAAVSPTAQASCRACRWAKRHHFIFLLSCLGDLLARRTAMKLTNTACDCAASPHSCGVAANARTRGRTTHTLQLPLLSSLRLCSHQAQQN